MPVTGQHERRAPEGLIAASHIDLPAVTERIIMHLASDDDPTREAGADAARVLLALDVTRVIALGSPLAASVRGPESGYAGYPHPTSAALRALAEAWRGEPEVTRRIVEAEAAGASHEARGDCPGFRGSCSGSGNRGMRQRLRRRRLSASSSGGRAGTGATRQPITPPTTWPTWPASFPGL